MDGKKPIFQIDHDLLQEFFNKDNSQPVGGSSFYEEEMHDKEQYRNFNHPPAYN